MSSLSRIRTTLGYFFLVSYRRKILDTILSQKSHLYHGVVLDIGGRDRGSFQSPKQKVTKWIIADIVASRNPDLVLDVSQMTAVADASINCVNALELFEHVEYPRKGLQECYRVLQSDGLMLFSMPFLYPIHGDPYDFQRWTETKIQKEIVNAGFTIQEIIPMGFFFTVLSDFLRAFLQSSPPLRLLSLPFIPLLHILSSLDKLSCIYDNKKLNKYTTGYFVIAKKI